MSQQTSMYDFYRSVNLRSQMGKKPKINAAKLPVENNLKEKTRRSKKIKKEPPVAVSPSKINIKSPIKNHSGSSTELVDLINSDDELSAATNDVQSPKLLHELSVDSRLPRTPTKVDQGHKRRSVSVGNSESSSPRKKSQTNGARSVTKHLKHRSPIKWEFRSDAIETVKVSNMIENLNLSRAHILPKNHFNLDEVYRAEDFIYDDVVWNQDNILHPYDFNGVVIPKEKHAEHLFKIITEVFSHQINCGYFDDQELDMVFKILISSEKAQMLLARMIKRKYCWRRASSIEYPEIANNLKPYFAELEGHRLITSNMEDESLETLLVMLPADDVHDICRKMKIARQSNKDLAVKQLLKTSSIKPLFPGSESPAAVLRKTVLTSLDHCVCLPDEVINLIDRIVTLFIPSEDVTTAISDLFLKLTMINEGTLRYPEVYVKQFPVFQNREHLLRYIQCRNKLREALEATKGSKENCNFLRNLGREAHSRLTVLLGENPVRQEEIAVPRHVQKFQEEYVCIKIVTTCLEAFKKENSTIPEAIEILRNLISQESYLQSRKGEWFEELALIEMKHKKDLEAAALVTIEGLMFKNITESGKHILTKRASIIAKRKFGLNVNTKSQLRNLIDKEMLRNTPTVSINANMIQGNQPGRKSTWSLDMAGGDKGYLSVEQRAQYYYRNNGYPEGWHCEGSLPVMFFTLLMWDELYSVPVAAAYLSAYQKAPLDLFTSEFYSNRKEHIDRRIETIKALSADELGSLIEKSFEIQQHYESLMPTSFLNSEQLKDIVRCMGTAVVIGICKRLVSNFCAWRSGFPDLLVWNSVTLKCKFVEVKGPGDTLSAKQTLWLRYLEDLGAVTELCEVKAGCKKD